MKEAYFAGGCFWCVTPIYKMYGVDEVICGYAGGDEKDPTYEQVKHQETGHRETIKLVYDSEKYLTTSSLISILPTWIRSMRKVNLSTKAFPTRWPSSTCPMTRKRQLLKRSPK